MMKRKWITFLVATLASLFLLTGMIFAEAAPQIQFPRSKASLDLQAYLEADPALMALMEKSIEKAHEINPDPDTNPVDSVESFYEFLDLATIALPWNVIVEEKHPTLYDHIDQSVDYIWFLIDQPLDELKDCGYYYPTLQYHEPIATWCREYSDDWGAFLSTEDSWNDEIYRRIKDDPSMNMQYGWYADTNVWHTFNEWFSRHLIDPSVRPIADSDVVAPADSTPQGVWDIDDTGNLVQNEGVTIKSANFTSITQLIGPDSDYADAFAGGTLTHTFLDVNDYHRYHFPVSGTILEVRKIPAVNGAGGITEWDPENKRYVLCDSIPGWQMIETRDCVIIDTEEYGLVAVLPIGMSQICSCNWEDSVQVGAHVEKGDPMGYFLFGGSDIVMVFQSCVDVSIVCPQDEDGDGYEHLLMGEAYAQLAAADQETKETTGTLDKIRENGILRVGSAGDYLPMSYLDPDTGEYIGFDAELAEDLAESLGVGVEYVKTSWPTLMEDTLAGKFDLAICGITVTDARKEQALMSDGYLENGKTVLCRAEDADKYTSLAAINKPEVRVMENPGGLNEKFARENLPDATLIIHDVNQEIPGLVASGEADVMITEIMEAGYYTGQDERLAAPLIHEPFTNGELGVLMPKGSEELLAYVNEFLAEEKKTGRLDELAEKYIYRNTDSDQDLEPAA